MKNLSNIFLVTTIVVSWLAIAGVLFTTTRPILGWFVLTTPICAVIGAIVGTLLEDDKEREAIRKAFEPYKSKATTTASSNKAASSIA